MILQRKWHGGSANRTLWANVSGLGSLYERKRNAYSSSFQFQSIDHLKHIALERHRRPGKALFLHRIQECRPIGVVYE